MAVTMERAQPVAATAAVSRVPALPPVRARISASPAAGSYPAQAREPAEWVPAEREPVEWEPVLQAPWAALRRRVVSAEAAVALLRRAASAAPVASEQPPDAVRAMSDPPAGRFRTAWSPRLAAAEARGPTGDGSSPPVAEESRHGSAAKWRRRSAGDEAGGRAGAYTTRETSSAGTTPPPPADATQPVLDVDAMPTTRGASRATPASAAPPAASFVPTYLRLSRKTPCSPNMFASREKRRQGTRLPPSSAASQRSTT